MAKSNLWNKPRQKGKALFEYNGNNWSVVLKQLAVFQRRDRSSGIFEVRWFLLGFIAYCKCFNVNWGWSLGGILDLLRWLVFDIKDPLKSIIFLDTLSSCVNNPICLKFTPLVSVWSVFLFWVFPSRLPSLQKTLYVCKHGSSFSLCFYSLVRQPLYVVMVNQ